MKDEWIKDTGIVLSLIFLILGFKGKSGFLTISIILLLFTIIWLRALYPIAFIWQKIAELLGYIMPKIFFGLVFFIIITPIGILRKIFNKGNENIMNWRGVKSLFILRNKLYTEEDLEKPY